MARSFDVTTETSASVAAVLSAFARRDYWTARLAAYGGDSITLDELVVGDNGAVMVRTTQDIRQDMLPGAFARMLPGNTMITRTETWRPAAEAESRADGEFTISARGVPSSGSGTMALEGAGPDGTGSSLRVRGALEVKIPIIGGQIERFVADLIVKEVPQMQQFTAEWIDGKV